MKNNSLFGISFPGMRITFSRNCCSGIVFALGIDARCKCWRCLEKRGEPHDETTEAEASVVSKKAQRAFRSMCFPADVGLSGVADAHFDAVKKAMDDDSA